MSTLTTESTEEDLLLSLRPTFPKSQKQQKSLLYFNL